MCRWYAHRGSLKAWRCSVVDRVARYRDAAGVDSGVTFSMIRDAAYSIACGAVALCKAKVLAGHKLPGSVDHYVLRNPGFVADACAAMRAESYRKRRLSARCLI